MPDFEGLYEKYATDVLRVCYFYLGDRQKAEDVCQDVFVRLMVNTPELEEGHEKAWLLKVALNRCRDLWRGSWARRVVLGSPTFESIPAPDDTAKREDEEAMMVAIHRLPTVFREVILLHYYQNFGISIRMSLPFRIRPVWPDPVSSSEARQLRWLCMRARKPGTVHIWQIRRQVVKSAYSI